MFIIIVKSSLVTEIPTSNCGFPWCFTDLGTRILHITHLGHRFWSTNEIDWFLITLFFVVTTHEYLTLCFFKIYIYIINYNSFKVRQVLWFPLRTQGRPRGKSLCRHSTRTHSRSPSLQTARQLAYHAFHRRRRW